MGFPRRDRRTDAARLAVSTMAWHSAGSDVTKIVPQRGNDAFGPARQARAQRARCVSGGSDGRDVSSSSHPGAHLHIGHGPSPVGETPRSVISDALRNTHPRTHLFGPGVGARTGAHVRSIRSEARHSRMTERPRRR